MTAWFGLGFPGKNRPSFGSDVSCLISGAMLTPPKDGPVVDDEPWSRLIRGLFLGLKSGFFSYVFEENCELFYEPYVSGFTSSCTGKKLLPPNLDV